MLFSTYMAIAFAVLSSTLFVYSRHVQNKVDDLQSQVRLLERIIRQRDQEKKSHGL